MKFPKTQVIALANQKGGCGKTTSAISIAATFAHLGYSAAIVDTDQQCNATMHFGVSPDELFAQGKHTVLDAYMAKRAAINFQIGFGERFNNKLFLVPGNKSLKSIGPRFDLEVQVELTKPNRADIDGDDVRREQRFRLRDSLNSLRGVHDVVIIDTPPDLDFIMTSALAAADWFIVPVFPSGYDLDGLKNLITTVNKVRSKFNPDLKLAGILLGNVEPNRKLHSEIHGILCANFGKEAVFQTTIGHGVKMQELTVLKRTVFEHEPSKRQAEEYKALVGEMINRGTRGKYALTPLPDMNEFSERVENVTDMNLSPEALLEVANG